MGRFVKRVEYLLFTRSAVWSRPPRDGRGLAEAVVSVLFRGGPSCHCGACKEGWEELFSGLVTICRGALILGLVDFFFRSDMPNVSDIVL